VVQPSQDDSQHDLGSEREDGKGPYRNLWVPLVVVPFAVVGVIVLVFVFFGAIGGREASLQENLQTVVNGGSNERKQAAVSLAAQVLENYEARLAGREPPWDAGPDFLAEVQAAWSALPPDDNPRIRLALAQVAASYGDPEALEKLAGFLALPEGDDPEGELAVQAMMALSWLRDERAAGLLVPFLEHPDTFLQLAAAASLQNVPGEESLGALRGLLSSPSLELRGQAAISLARLGDPAGAEVLGELVDPETYVRAREADPRKFASERFVHDSRLAAVRALGRLGRPQDRPLLEGLAAGDDDPAVREAAMRALEGSAGPTDPGGPAGG
jgi:HEAT repeat protein